MLKDLIIELYERVNHTDASSEVKIRLDELLEENNLAENRKVPAWFIEFLENVLAQKEVKRSTYAYNSEEGDISNFLAELEHIIPADWNDNGESIVVNFPNLEMKICISTEGNFYEAFKSGRSIALR